MTHKLFSLREKLVADAKEQGSVKAPVKVTSKFRVREPVRTAPAAVWGRRPWRAVCWPGTVCRGQDSPGTHRAPAARRSCCSSYRSEHKSYNQSWGRLTGSWFKQKKTLQVQVKVSECILPTIFSSWLMPSWSNLETEHYSIHNLWLVKSSAISRLCSDQVLFTNISLLKPTKTTSVCS